MADTSKTVGTGQDVTLQVSQSDLRLIRAALEEFLASFSHEQGDVVDRIKTLLDRLPGGEDRKGKGTENSPFRRLTL